MTSTSSRCSDWSVCVFMYLNREDSWENGAGDANGPTVFGKFKESFSPEKKLGDDEVCTSINLLLQVPEVIFIALSLWVTRGVTYHYIWEGFELVNVRVPCKNHNVQMYTTRTRNLETCCQNTMCCCVVVKYSEWLLGGYWVRTLLQCKHMALYRPPGEHLWTMVICLSKHH